LQQQQPVFKYQLEQTKYQQIRVLKEMQLTTFV